MKTVFNPLVGAPDIIYQDTEQLARAFELNWKALLKRSLEIGSEDFMPKHRIEQKQLWLFPELDSKVAQKFKSKSAEREYGCGAYGCVYQTFDPKVVFKLTLDEPEAQIAHVLTRFSQYPRGVVKYYGAFQLRGLYGVEKDLPMYALWREEAVAVGRDVLDYFRDHVPVQDALINDLYTRFPRLLIRVKNSGETIYWRVHNLLKDDTKSTQFKRKTLNDWWEDAMFSQGNKTPVGYRLHEYAGEVAELVSSPLGENIASFFSAMFNEMIIIGDTHLGNVGLTRADADARNWKLTVTDPGHVSFFAEKWAKSKPPMI